MTRPQSINPADYTLAWICALPLELAAAEAILDEHHSHSSTSGAQSEYVLGNISGHNVVVGCLPSGVYGTNSAAAAVTRLLSAFPNVRYGLMVGIGGGAPSKKVDIRLGDVVVSKPVGRLGGVIQYDLGKSVGDGRFELTGMLNQPPAVLLTAVSRLESEQMGKKNTYISSKIGRVLAQHINMRTKFSRPAQEDRLFRASYSHSNERPSCSECDSKEQIDRPPRPSTEPQIHYGTIASGNRVVKNGRQRDEIAQEFDAICFEMEAAGIMNHLPCIVVRGICDYCDSHKNKEWQGYAALAAATCAKQLLGFVAVSGLCQPQTGESKKGHFMVPFERNPRFQGREDTVRQLADQILSIDHRKARKAAISGLGGMGKTQVALELTYTIRQEDPARSIFWIPSTSIEAVEQAYRNLARLLGVSDGGSDDVKSIVKHYLSSERAAPWVLIIDNADDFDMWLTSRTSPALKTFLPASQQGFILFTSRNGALVSRLVGPNVIQLSEMDDMTSVALLKDSLIQKDLTKDEISTTMLVDRLCGLPLALVQASSFINENSMSLKIYLNLLDQQEESMIQLLSENFEDEYRYPETENPVSATWLISFQSIQESNKLAEEYLRFMACIDCKDIPLSLLPEPETELEKEKALGVLKAYSFISQQANSEFATMHRLVHLATRNWLRKENILPGCTMAAGEHISAVFPEGDHEDRSLWRKYLPHAQVLLEREEFEHDGDVKDDLAGNVGRCLVEDGRDNDAEYLLLKCVASRRERLDASDPRLLRTISDLAGVYCAQGKFKEAEDASIQVLHSRQAVLGDDHPDTLLSKHELAASIYLQSRLKEAEIIYRQVLQQRKSILGDEDPATLATMFALGEVLANSGRLQEAEELQVRVVELRKVILGPEHPHTLSSMGSLAKILLELGRLSEAEELQLKVYKVQNAILGDNHRSTLASMGHLACIYHEMNRLDESEELDAKTLEIRKAILGPEHPDTLTSMSNLAVSFQVRGRLADAEKLALRTLDIRKATLGATHQDTLVSMDILADVWKDQGRPYDAIALLSECTELQESHLGPDHPDTISTKLWLESWRQDLHNKPPPEYVDTEQESEGSKMPKKSR
ncbi:hypothetical protein ASPSYDRAFT_89112 [Aspergillus sydowii CBS 593.65]|uniref:Nucleoside phosphorylase domain-containing protein n=1 Tax=Aspergillus sydowii CBS 593.65 TaxID=1036612 RepID=A0A1L9TLD2_9EURO|nr:uncharacterized protein ASPSYDRAFT_89112 [Aspergillus sydowii CBS 593.65]OJJ60235.1 hypothetical protein ASPSYDRAFT_89112 [Aspergillus sydowii CBS 593.65]